MFSIRWEDGNNNLTSNLFTLITPLTTHKNTSDIHVCSYKPYTEKKREKSNNNIRKNKIIIYIYIYKN